ncbi:MAG: hypothetical protein ACI865_002739 [Flavobacteriaceae bacterium]|jgi:hypothetical protein
MLTKSIIPEKYEPLLKKWLPVLVFLLGMWYFCIRILGPGLEYIPGDFGDSRFINFLLEHGYQCAIGNSPEFWNAGFMYPFENTIAFSDNMLGTMPIYGFWRMFGVSQETSYQLWWMVICALNFWSAYFVVKKWFSRWDLAIIAAWIFAFTIFNLGQFSYVQMMIRFMVPIVLYSGAKMVDTSSIKHFGIFALGSVVQFYALIYTGFFLMYFSLLFIVIYAIFKKKYFFFVPLFKGKNLLYIGGISVVAMAAMAWLMLPYYEMSKYTGMRMYEDVIGFVPVIQSYFYVQESSYAWNILYHHGQPEVPNYWLHYIFPGMIPLVGLLSIPFLWIYWKLRRIQISPLTWALSITAFLVFVFFTRTYDGQSLYAILFKLPGMASIRIVNRFMHVEIFLIILVMVSYARRIPRAWALVILVLVIVDNSFTTENIIRSKKSEIVTRRQLTINQVQKGLKPEHKAFAIVDENEEFFITQIDAMTTINYVNLPTVNGYSSGCPGEFGTFFYYASQEGLNNWLEFSGVDPKTVLVIRR